MTKDQVREIFVRHGFTVKEGQSDLKDYVYAAAAELLEAHAREMVELLVSVTLTQEREAPVDGDNKARAASWPTDAHGRLLCTPDKPMPAARDQMGQQWVHSGAHEVGNGDAVAHYRCTNCGHEWTREVPE